MMIQRPICLGCTRFDGTAPALRCTAYPNGIPDAIVRSEVDHRAPAPGDGGFLFEPRDTPAAAYAADLFPPEEPDE